MAKLFFLGTSDAFNAAGRANSCYWVEDALGHYVVDFGPTALYQCQRYGLDVNRLDGVFLTHLHGDHIGGLAMLLVHLQYQSDRKRPLVIAGPEGTEQRVLALRESAYPSVVRSGLQFPIEYRTWAVPGDVDVLGRKVRAIRARHDRIAVATSFRVDTDAYSFSFSGDTGWQPALADLVSGSDVFVCECTNVVADYWAHLSVEELEALRDQFHVKRMFVSHMSEPARAALLEAEKRLNVTVADDGLQVDVS